MAENEKTRVVTGIKPTGSVHIGNYFGAIKQAIDMANSDKYECFYFIADYHALNTIGTKRELEENFKSLACTWLACGLDPKKVVFYRQSRVHEITELCWILMNVTSKGLMNRAHAYKAIVEANAQKNADLDEGVNMGLFCYPILMAADILTFNSKVVPVGVDQKQHIEMARDIAKAFNKKYGYTLVVPREQIQESTATILGLDGRKMSKSYNNVLPLFASEAELKKLVMSIVTDSTLPNEPKSTNCTLFEYYKQFASEAETERMRERFNKGISWAEAKAELFEIMNKFLSPMRERYQYFMSHFEEVEKILHDGEERARAVARETLERVRAAIGVDYRQV